MFSISTALRAQGKLDQACLRRALAGLVARHEALRTRFKQGPAGPLQEVLPRAEVPFEVVDLRGAARDEIDVDSLLRSRRAQAFDLGQIVVYGDFKAKDILLNTELAADVFSSVK